MVIFVVLALLCDVALAGSLAAEPVITGNADQFGPAVSTDWIAWTQRTRNPRGWDVYVERSDGTERTVVGASGTWGFTGGLDPSSDRLLYQEVYRQSNLRWYELELGFLIAPPRGINTKLWEWRPDVSSQFILFGRNKFDRKSSPWRVILYDRALRTFKVLDSAPNRCRCIFPDAVTDRYAAWTKCRGGGCSVYVYDTATSTTSVVPNPAGSQHYYAAISDAGNVYFGESDGGCGRSVGIWRWAIGAPSDSAELIHSLGGSFELASRIDVVTDIEGHEDVYFDRASCLDDRFRADILVLRDAEVALPLSSGRGPATAVGVARPLPIGSAPTG